MQRAAAPTAGAGHRMNEDRAQSDDDHGQTQDLAAERDQQGGGPPIVALGTSAGGLAASVGFFEHLRPDTGCAFVVVQHLDPVHESHLVELLANATEMPVRWIRDAVVPEANHVYVIPPGVALSMEGAELRLRPREAAPTPMPIDGFLHALARARGPQAIAVIMSGSGSDGSLGVQSIRANGGFTLAQDPADAAFDGMPRAAIETGAIDVVLPAASLAKEVARIAREQSRSPLLQAGRRTEYAEDRRAHREVVERLRAATGVDFGRYRPTTVARRLLRRMSLRGVDDIHAYLALLDANPGEVQDLARDILISVTRFFRDPEVFDFLESHVLPDLIRHARNGEVRIWVVGCSTGEEAYSLAMSFVETARRMHSDVTCQIFATDVNEAVLAKARQGQYLPNIAADVSPARLRAFFGRTNGGYQIARSIRNLCVFSRHDLLSDPTLSRMDLVSCRNLLIYLATSQRPVLEALHFALEPQGYLLLGQAESASTCPDLFDEVQKDAHVFRARQQSVQTAAMRVPRDSRRRLSSSPPIDHGAREVAYEELIAANEELQSLNEEFESSKEEIEAVNEELRTLNQELRERNASLQAAHEFLETTMDTMRSALVVVDRDGRIVNANRSFHLMFHLEPGSVTRRRLAEAVPDYFGDGPIAALLRQVGSDGHARDQGEFSFPSSARGACVLAVNVRAFAQGNSLLIAIDDVTLERRLEAERRQSQKMAAIGHLAAGVAHDFNNLLTVVLAGTQSIKDKLPADSPDEAVLVQVLAAVRRAAELTRQLLAYAGKGRFYVERVDLSNVVVQSASLLHASVPTHVQLRLDLDPDLPPLLADRSQLHQVVDNLIKNAIEAIGDRAGIVTVRTGQLRIGGDEYEGIEPGTKLPAGPYLFLEVQDTGAGLSEQDRRQMFDPFFTTKFTGRGLGLAVVQGIVRQHRGAIRVTSVLGRGTAMRVLLSTAPLSDPSTPQHEEGEPRRGSETILVVDDEPLVLESFRLGLSALGYRVVVAGGGPHALGVLRAEPKVDAVILDANMPGMNGLETLQAIRKMRSDLPILICSGAGDAATESAFAGHRVAGFLQKPFTRRDLGGAVAACFAAPR